MFLISSSTVNLLLFRKVVVVALSAAAAASSLSCKTTSPSCSSFPKSFRPPLEQSTSSWNLLFSTSDLGIQPAQPFTPFFVLKSFPSVLRITGEWSQVRSLTSFRYLVVERKSFGPIVYHQVVSCRFESPRPAKCDVHRCHRCSSRCLALCSLNSFNS